MPDEGRILDISVEGLTEFQGALDQARKTLAKELRRGHREIAVAISAQARSSAQAGTPMQRRFASALQPRATQTAARIGIVTTGRNAGANYAFFGGFKRTGWYAADRFASSTTRQFPEWVGSFWRLESPGEGPYIVADTIRRSRPFIGEKYLQAHDRALAKAFPNGGPT